MGDRNTQNFMPPYSQTFFGYSFPKSESKNKQSQQPQQSPLQEQHQYTQDGSHSLFSWDTNQQVPMNIKKIFEPQNQDYYNQHNQDYMIPRAMSMVYNSQNQIFQQQDLVKQNFNNFVDNSHRTSSLGNIEQVDKLLDTQQVCVVCLKDVNQNNDFTYTFHPALKYFCPIHKECQQSLRKDSELIQVPKFEVKSVSEQHQQYFCLRTPKPITIELQVLHPISKQVLFKQEGIQLQSQPFLSQVESRVRHLFHYKVQQEIQLPVYMVHLQIIWRNPQYSNFPKVISGIIDLSDFIGSNAVVGSNVSVGLNQQDVGSIELQFKLNHVRTIDLSNQSLIMKELSFVLDINEISDITDTTSCSSIGSSVKSQRQLSNTELIYQDSNNFYQSPRNNTIASQQVMKQDSAKKSQFHPSQQEKLQQMDPSTIKEFIPKKKALSIQYQDSSQFQSPKDQQKNSLNSPMNNQQIASNRLSAGPTAVQEQLINKNKLNTIDENIPNFKEGEILQKILTKNGSKELQKQIDKINPLYIEAIVTEIEPQFDLVLIDQYGNYFCQKLFTKLNDEQKYRLLNRLFDKDQYISTKKKKYKKFLKVAADSRGTHALQCFLECLLSEKFILEIEEMFRKDLLKFAYNKHATHVLIKFIRLTDVQPYLEQIFNVIMQNFTDLSQDSNGLPVIKTTIAKFSSQSHKEQMVKCLSDNVVMLAQNAYGNYAIQVALENWTNDDCQMLYKSLIPQLQQLSVQKFSSNVVEKVLDKADQNIVELYAKELSTDERIRILIRVNYGYYVVERIMLRCTNDKAKSELRNVIQKNLGYLGSNSLKNKWIDLIERSKTGSLHLFQIARHE